MSIDPQEQPPPLPIPSAVRFCNRCGADWQPEWVACIYCAPKAEAHDEPADNPAAYDELISVKSSLRLYFLLLAVSAIALLVGLIRQEPPPVESELVVEAVMAVITVLYAIAHRKAVLPSLLRVGPVRYLCIAPVAAVLTFLFAHAVVVGLSRFTGQDPIGYSEGFLEVGYGWWIVILAISFQPAVIEELAFRGVILPALNRAMGVGEAIVVSAMIFAILHLSIVSLPHLLAIGLVLGWLRHKSGSLYPCMLMHFTHNSLVLAAEKFGSPFGY